MPNVSVYIPGPRMPDAEKLDRFTATCTELCTGVLKATLNNVHIIFIPVLPQGRGHSAWVEVQYRLETFRPPEVMKDFIAKVDRLVKDEFGFTARIRCFGYGAEAVHALN